jgi:pyruvate/2-oxoglutarate dehydrogenase complex dihydrolipoamide dehydrogenase (E3) component
LLHLCKKAFLPAKIPFPLLHIDTGHNFPETISHRDELVKRYQVQLQVGRVQQSIDQGTVIEEKGKYASSVNHALDYQTNIPGIFAVGDVNTYPGKLKLILCGFHEATLAIQSCYKIINPDKKYTMKYSTVQGVQGFEKVAEPN